MLNFFIFVLTVLLFGVLFVKGGSNFTTSTQIIGTTPEKEKINSIAPDTVLIFYAPWCGYCKSSMDEFQKAVDSGNGKILLINGDENRDLMVKYGVKGFPTIMKGNNVHTGGRTSSEILDFADDKN